MIIRMEISADGGGDAPVHAMTVDLEEWFHGIELAESEWPSTSRLRIGLDRLLALFDENGTRATFYVLGAVADRFPSMIREIADLGHEIGCHGYAHRFVYQQTPEEFSADLRRACDSIQDATGKTVRGYRAPYFSIRADTSWAYEVLAETGFTYDSSIFPVHNYRYGIPCASCDPYSIETPSGNIQEIPITPFQLAGLNIPFSGGAYLRILPWAVQRLLWEVSNRRGKRLVAYIHPWELDPDHPRISLPGRVAATHYARLHLTERRLGRLVTLYHFGRMDHVFLN